MAVPLLRPLFGRRRRTGQTRHPVTDDGSMPLVEHLRELRWRLVVCLVALVPGFVLGIIFYQSIVNFLTEPICDVEGGISAGLGKCGPLVVQGLIAPFGLMVKVALATAIVLSAPIWLSQLWGFVTPGLHHNERRWTLGFLGTGIPLFFGGAVLCYLILPKATQLLLGFTPDDITNIVPFEDYLSIVLRLIIVFGLAFQAPVFIVLLNAAGVLPAAALRRHWRAIVLGTFVFAAVATPTGDPITMLTLALPVLALVGLAYLVARAHDRRHPSEEPDYAALDDDETSALDLTPSSIDPADDWDGRAPRRQSSYDEVP